MRVFAATVMRDNLIHAMRAWVERRGCGAHDPTGITSTPTRPEPRRGAVVRPVGALRDDREIVRRRHRGGMPEGTPVAARGRTKKPLPPRAGEGADRGGVRTIPERRLRPAALGDHSAGTAVPRPVRWSSSSFHLTIADSRMTTPRINMTIDRMPLSRLYPFEAVLR